MVLKVAITGNIASGKSQVENFLAEKYPVYDTDKMVHELLNELTDFYGLDVFTNEKIDRKKLGKIVFSNAEYKKKLEDIIHPKVKERISEIFKKHENEKIVFISVPLLYESGFDKLFDKTVIVTTDEKSRIARLMERDNISEDEAMRKINSQLSQEEKVRKADYEIKNYSDIKALKIEIENFLNTIQ